MKKHSGHLSLTIVLLSLSVNVLSCGRIRHKGEVLADKTEAVATAEMEKVQKVVAEQIEEIFPGYDGVTPDTDVNKQRFKDHLGINAHGNVKGLYAYADFIGIDYKVLMTFTCDQSTIDSIIRKNGMKQSTEKDDTGLTLAGCPDWWKTDVVEKLIPYKVGEEDAFWQYLWYNPANKQAFYQEFSM